MIAFPSLQSFCIVPKDQNYAKRIAAHDYLLDNPQKLNKIMKSSLHKTRKTSYNVKFTVKDIEDCSSVLDFLLYWGITDFIDFSPSKPTGSFSIQLRSAVSAYSLSKLPGVNIVIMDNLPKTVRAPTVFIQGIPASTPAAEVCEFFKDIAHIMKVKVLQRNGFEGHLLRVATPEIALRIVEMSQGMKYGDSMLTVSHQYKQDVTEFFVINTIQGVGIPINDVISEVAKFGEVTEYFQKIFAGIDSCIIRMKNIKDSRLACGFMNGRLYDGLKINAIFIEENYFLQLRGQ